MDPGLLLKSAGLQAKHCVSHHQTPDTHTQTPHRNHPLSCLVGRAPLRPNVTECNRAHMVHEWTNASANTAPWEHCMLHPHASGCSFIGYTWPCVRVYVREPSGRIFHTGTACLEVTGLHRFNASDCSVSKCSHTHCTLDIHFKRLESFEQASKHTETKTGKHTDPKSVFVYVLKKLAAENV